MKNIIALVLATLTVVLAGCTTTKVPYSETKKPDASFHFRNTRYSYLMEPQALDNGYAREITPANLEASLQELNVTNRSFAQVSLYWNVSVEETRQVIGTWTALLKQHQFDRIVFIRENGVAAETSLIHDNHRTDNPPITAGEEHWVPMRAGSPFASGGL
jgi:hypothetical protein